MTVRQDSPLHIGFTITATQHIPDQCRVQALLNFAASRESLAGEVSIWLCTDDEIAELHVRFMDIVGPTDVITFPDDETTEDAYLGDIAVSVDSAAGQAKDAGHSAQREVAYLCLHGFLHLARYNDLTDDGRAVMIARQEELLSEFEREKGGDWVPAADG